MSNLPLLLEQLACTPYGDDAFAAAVDRLEPELRAALLGRDTAGLVAALSGRLVMACLIMSPDQEETPEPAEQPEEDQPDDDAQGS
ncbi:MAG TPA: hypothetical protein VFE72_00620 [Lysobacter sp.]|nr:hypothetical protein [Lysobacter sp.]